MPPNGIWRELRNWPDVRIDIVSTGSNREETIVCEIRCSVTQTLQANRFFSYFLCGTFDKPQTPLLASRSGEPLAQSVEHRPFKARALGSSPSAAHHKKSRDRASSSFTHLFVQHGFRHGSISPLKSRQTFHHVPVVSRLRWAYSDNMVELERLVHQVKCSRFFPIISRLSGPPLSAYFLLMLG